MMLAKLVGGALALSLANAAVVQFSVSEPTPDPTTRKAMAVACLAALPEHTREARAAPPEVARLKPLGNGHYWVTLVPGVATGARPVGCDLVRDHASWRAESVTVIEW